MKRKIKSKKMACISASPSIEKMGVAI